MSSRNLTQKDKDKTIQSSWGAETKRWFRSKLPILSHAISIPFIGVCFTYSMAFTLSLTVLPFQTKKLLGRSGFTYGVVLAAYNTTKMLSAPMIGHLSDKHGRRRAILYTTFGTALSFALTPLFDSIPWIIVCRLATGCFAANGAMITCYAMDACHNDAAVLPMFLQCFHLGWGMSYLLAAPVITVLKENPHLCFRVASCFMFMSTALVYYYFEEMGPSTNLPEPTNVASPHTTHNLNNAANHNNTAASMTSTSVSAVLPPSSSTELAHRIDREREGDNTYPHHHRNSSATLPSLSASSDASASHASSTDNNHSVETDGMSPVTRLIVVEAENARRTAEDKQRSEHSNARVEKVQSGGSDSDASSTAQQPATFFQTLQAMFGHKLILCLFLTSLFTPPIELTVLLTDTFKQGPATLGLIHSIGAVCRLIVPLTPIVAIIASRLGHRRVATIGTFLNGVVICCLPHVNTLEQLYFLMFMKSVVFVCYEPSKTSYLTTMGKPATVGAYVGWLACMKGFAAVTSGVLGGYLSGEGVAIPYTLTGTIICFDAFLIYYFKPPHMPAAVAEKFSPSQNTKNVNL